SSRGPDVKLLACTLIIGARLIELTGPCEEPWRQGISRRLNKERALTNEREMVGNCGASSPLSCGLKEMPGQLLGGEVEPASIKRRTLRVRQLCQRHGLWAADNLRDIIAGKSEDARKQEDGTDCECESYAAHTRDQFADG